MRIALIKNNVVVDVIECASVALATALRGDVLAVESQAANVGDCYSGAHFSAPQPDLAELKHQLIARIRAERDRRKLNGVQVSGKWIHTDTYSRTQWMSMKIMGGAVPAVDWTTMDGTTIPTAPALVAAVFDAVAALDTALFNYARNLIEQVEASSNPAGINIKSGWPLTFGE